MKQFILFLFAILFFLQVNAQSQVSEFDSSSACLTDSAKASFPFVTGVPENYRIPIWKTLSYFPELAGCHIAFKTTHIATTANVRPSIGSLFFRSKNNRRYIVRINNSLKDSIILINDVPIEAMFGLFGHEFTHIVDYNSKNCWGVFRRAYAYLYKSKKERFEKEIDLLTIQRGLGRSLYQWSQYVLYRSVASVKYKQFKRKIYLKPEEIEKYVNARPR